MGSQDGLAQALATLTREPVEALYVHIGVFMYRYRERIVEFTRTHQLPTRTSSKALLRSGLLMFY